VIEFVVALPQEININDVKREKTNNQQIQFSFHTIPFVYYFPPSTLC